MKKSSFDDPNICNLCSSGCQGKHSLFFFSPSLSLSANFRFLVHSFGCWWVNILWSLPLTVFGHLVCSWSVPIYSISEFPIEEICIACLSCATTSGGVLGLRLLSGLLHLGQPWNWQGLSNRRKKGCEISLLLLTGMEQLVFSFEERLYLTLSRQTATSVCKWIQLFKCRGQKMKGILFKQCAPESQIIFLMSVFCKWKSSLFQH